MDASNARLGDEPLPTDRPPEFRDVPFRLRLLGDVTGFGCAGAIAAHFVPEPVALLLPRWTILQTHPLHLAAVLFVFTNVPLYRFFQLNRAYRARPAEAGGEPG